MQVTLYKFELSFYRVFDILFTFGMLSKKLLPVKHLIGYKNVVATWILSKF